MINIGAEDYNVLKQQYIKKYIRLELLDFQYNIVDELSGNMTKCSINVDSTSDLRRSCDLGFVVTTSTFDIKAGSKLWLDKMVRPYVGYENMRTGEIQWYNQGIYLVNNPQWSYNASTNEISMQALDLMSKLTGLRNGNLEGIPTKIAKDENVREAIIKTIELGGFTKYICEECKTKDGTIVPVPYDIEIDVGGTVYDILAGLRDIMPNYQIYFDVNGVFHYEPIPLAYDDPVLIDDDLFNNVLISENINTDFESVKNYVEVLGHTWDVDYYSPSDKTTVSGNTITPTFTDLKELQNDTAIGITLPSDVSSADKIIIKFLGDNDVLDINNEPIKKLVKDEEWIFQYVVQTEGEGESATTTKFWRFMGHQQAQAISYDNNPSSPFYVGNPIGASSVGRIRIVLYSGEYDNIYSDDLAQQRADFEIYQRSRLNDSISMETIPIPWIDANIVVSHRFGQKQEPSKYIIKSFSVDYATGGTMTINAITWYPYYEESEVV